MTRPWWRGAVFYEVYVRSFADSNDDGIGDLPGITSRLDHLKWLGVDALWLTPFYPAPQKDHGYDVADYYDVDPGYGTLADFDALVARAHELGLKVIVDLVPNHTSDQHPWFQAALSVPKDPHRAFYHFAPGKPDGSPPNHWHSSFGGPAWTRDDGSGQWYLHLFAPEQPDLHGVYRKWRRIVNSYTPDRVLVGEIFEPRRQSRYILPDQLNMAFALIRGRWDANLWRRSIETDRHTLLGPVAAPSWTLSNHDVVRHATRLGGGSLGQARSRAALLLVL